MEKPLVYVTFDLLNEKYYIGYSANNGDKIHNPIHDGRTYKGSGKNDDDIYFKDLPDDEWDQLSTQVLAYFDDQDDALIAESQLQKFMSCANDDNCYNRRDAVAIPKKNFFTNVVRVISNSLFNLGGSKEVTQTNDYRFNDDQLNKISNYIYNFDYTESYTKFNTLNINEPVDGPELEKEPDMTLPQFLRAATTASFDNGETKGYADPTQDSLDKNFEGIKIKLNSQLDDRLFSLQEEIVSIEAKVEIFINTGKVIDLKIALAKLKHEEDSLTSEDNRKKWADAIFNAFKEGFQHGADKRLSEL